MGGIFHVPEIDLDLNPFNDDDEGAHGRDPTPSRRVRLLREGRKWDGRGAPPSRDAAIGWLMQNGRHGLNEAEKVVGESGALNEVGSRVRRAAESRLAEREAQRKAGEVPTADDLAAMAEDGDVTADELAALGVEPLGSDVVDTRGAPLWRYEASPETLAEITVENKSWQDKSVQRAKRGWGAGSQERTGARYYEQDTLGPLRWSPEQRADLQRVLHGIGIYGDAKIKLGSWTSKDQAAYAELLASANEEGLTWHEMLSEWKRHPPEDILDELKDSGAVSKRPPIQVSNPLDIMQTARDVSRNLTGEVDRGFVEGTVKPYQGAETASQNAAYDIGEAGDGGTYAAAPSIGAFADDKLRRENPIEVDGYQFVNQFQSFMSMMGAS